MTVMSNPSELCPAYSNHLIPPPPIANPSLRCSFRSSIASFLMSSSDLDIYGSSHVDDDVSLRRARFLPENTFALVQQCGKFVIRNIVDAFCQFGNQRNVKTLATNQRHPVWYLILNP